MVTSPTSKLRPIFDFGNFCDSYEEKDEKLVELVEATPMDRLEV